MVRMRTALLLTALTAGLALPQACAGAETTGGPIGEQTIESVLERHTDRLMALPGVVGTAIGECEGTPCIKVLVRHMTPDLARRIPSILDGHRVVIEETGEIRALDPE
jgi:hypothetical protein